MMAAFFLLDPRQLSALSFEVLLSCPVAFGGAAEDNLASLTSGVGCRVMGPNTIAFLAAGTSIPNSAILQEAVMGLLDNFENQAMSSVLGGNSSPLASGLLQM